MVFTYQLTKFTSILRSDGASIPADPANRDYAEYLGWLAAGNTPTPVPPPTPAEIAATLEQAVQQYLDQQAQAKGYDNIISACSYAAAPNPYQTEGLSFLNWRAACWAECYTVQAAVAAGTQAVPTAAELIAQLPVRV